MLTFRIAITAAVIAFITALTASLVFTELGTFHAVARAAASAAMDAASASTLSRLEAEVSGLSSVVDVLSWIPSLADSDDRSEEDSAIVLFKAALHKLPQVDSFYIGYENGCWLQVRRLDVLGPVEREKLGAPPGAVYNVNLVRPISDGALPMRRIFEDEEGNKTGQLDLRDYGYDPRKRAWYRDTMQADRALVSAPYASFSIDTAMITLSAPLHGLVRGVIAADLKLDKFSEFVKTGEKANDQIDRCCCLRLSRDNLSTGNDSCAGSRAGRHDHASRLRLRPVQDTSWWCLRRQDHHPPCAPRSPQVCAMARRRLRSVGLLKRLAASKLLFLGSGSALRQAQPRDGYLNLRNCGWPPLGYSEVRSWHEPDQPDRSADVR